MLSPDLLDILRCPLDRQSRLVEDGERLVCTRCGLKFPIAGRLPQADRRGGGVAFRLHRASTNSPAGARPAPPNPLTRKHPLMADIRLGRYEIEHYDPPPVCIRCGAPSVVCKDHRFQWSPPWVYVLLLLGVIPYAIAAWATMKRMTVPVPLCERHKWHWGGRTAVVLLGLLGIYRLHVRRHRVR